MTSFEPIAIAALTKAVDFLFGEASKLMQERRAARQEQRKSEDTPNIQPGVVVTKKEDLQPGQIKRVYLHDVARELEHLLQLIEQYRSNKQLIEDTIAQYGGFKFAPIINQNQLLFTLDEIKRRSQEMKTLVEKVYGYQITLVGLD